MDALVLLDIFQEAPDLVFGILEVIQITAVIEASVLTEDADPAWVGMGHRTAGNDPAREAQ
jgi:hypothetical protein